MIIKMIEETENRAEFSVEGGELHLWRPGSDWEVNFYERSQVGYKQGLDGLFLQSGRLANHYFAGRKFKTPDEAAKAVATLVCV